MLSLDHSAHPSFKNKTPPGLAKLPDLLLCSLSVMRFSQGRCLSLLFTLQRFALDTVWRNATKKPSGRNANIIKRNEPSLIMYPLCQCVPCCASCSPQFRFHGLALQFAQAFLFFFRSLQLAKGFAMLRWSQGWIRLKCCIPMCHLGGQEAGGPPPELPACDCLPHLQCRALILEETGDSPLATAVRWTLLFHPPLHEHTHTEALLGLWKRSVGGQLQAQKQESIYLTQKRLNETSWSYFKEDQTDQTVTLWAANSLFSHIVGQRVTFWSLLSLLAGRGKGLCLSLLSQIFLGFWLPSISTIWGPRGSKSRKFLLKLWPSSIKPDQQQQKTPSKVCTLGALQRQAVLQGAFVKIGDFIKFKGFLVEFLESRRSWENQQPPGNRQKSGLFWASPFTMHLVGTLLTPLTSSGAVHSQAQHHFWQFSTKWRSSPSLTPTIDQDSLRPCAPSQCLALKIVSPLSRGNFCPCLTLSEIVS